MIPQPNLETLRLVLRPFGSADVQPVAQLVNDEQLSRNLRTFTYPFSIDDAGRWVGELSGEWETGKSAVFAICRKATDQILDDGADPLLVGAVGIVIEQPSNRAEVGFWVGRQYWGQGIATEACVSLLDFAFGQLGLNKVYAECLTRNPASSAVLQKVGMVQEGVLAKHFRKSQTEEYCDVQVFGLLRSVWNER